MRAFILTIVLAGCGLHLKPSTQHRLGESAPMLPLADCNKLDDKVTGLTATAIVVGVLSGGSGITSIFTDSTSRYVTGGISIGLTASTSLFGYLSTHFAARYAHECTVNVGGK